MGNSFIKVKYLIKYIYILKKTTKWLINIFLLKSKLVSNKGSMKEKRI